MHQKFILRAAQLPIAVKRLMVLLTCILASVNLFAQVVSAPPYFNATGTTANAFPLNSATSNKINWIYGPGAFTSLGAGSGTPLPAGQLITKIFIKFSATVNATTAYPNFTISMGQNVGTASNFGTVSNTSYAFNTGLTTVFNQSGFQFTGITANAWYGITLQTPFPYNPSLGLVVEVKANPSTAGGNGVANVTTSGQMQRCYGAFASATGTSNTGLTPIGFEVIPSSGCTSPPTPGTITVSPSTPFCLGGTASLTLTGNSTGSGQTYQWQSSTISGGPYTSISGATNTMATVSPSATSYYRCQVTCGGNTVSTPEAMVTVNPPFPGGNYTINSALPTGGSNFQSFSAAVAAMSCGISSSIVFDVAPGSGPYNEQITLPSSIGSNATKTVTFNGNGNTIQFASTDANNRHVIRLDGADYITFDNFTINASSGTYGWGVHLMNGADYNTFSLCNINTSTTNVTAYNHVPIVVVNSVTSPLTTGNGGNYNTFIDDNVNGGYYAAVTYGTAIGTENFNNSFINVQFKNFYSYGLYAAYQKNLTVSGCDFSRPTRITTTTTASVYMTTGCMGALVENSRIHNYFDSLSTSTSTLYGIYVAGDGSSAFPNRLINNVIYNQNSNGIQYGVYTSGADYLQVYHNTISLDNTSSTAGTTYGIYQTTAAVGQDYRNNMISITRGGSGAKVGLNFVTTTSAITSNYNVVYMGGAGSGTLNYGNFGGTNFATLANWQTANGGIYDLNSSAADPAYLSPSTGDFTPTSILVNNLGSNVGVMFDILGNPRTVLSPDPGAFEFDIVGMDAGISWVSPTTPTTAGLKTITVSVINNLSTVIHSLQLAYTDGSTPVVETFTGLNITSGNAQNFSFSTQYNLTGNATLRSYIMTVNGSLDDAQGNDTTAWQSLCLSLNGNYTINAGAPASVTNFQSFTALSNALSCGGVTGPLTVDVVSGSGPYNEQVTFTAYPGASAVNTVTINGNGNTLTFPSGTDFHTLRLNGADYLRFTNLNIATTGSAGAIALIMSNAADNNQFTACNFSVPGGNVTSTSSCVAFSASTTSPTSGGANGSNNLFSTCTMTGGYYCVSVYGASGATNQGNQFSGCTIKEYYIYGLYHIYGVATLIQDCIFERPTRTNISTGYGILLTTGSNNCLVQRNRVRKLFDGATTSASTCYGLYCSAAASAGNENKLINNIVSDIQSAGPIYGMYFSGASYIQAYHNTISLNHTTSTATGVTYGIYTSTATGTDYRNNIISITRGGTGTKYCAYYVTAMPALSNYNNFYMNAAAGTNYVAYNGVSATGYATLAAWQSGNPTYDQQSVSIEPIFTDPSTQNYEPSNFSLDNLGFNVGIATDINNNVRSTTAPDMGAYEFTISPIDMGVSGFVSPGTTGCYTATENIVVTIKNYGFNPIDFSVNPVTVNATMSGPSTGTASVLINTGTLAPGATQNVTLTGTVDMTLAGVYSFTANTVVSGDGNSVNNALASPVTRTVATIAGTASSNFMSLCNSGSPILTLTGNYGGAIQWKQSTIGAGGPWTNVGSGAVTYAPTLVTQSTWYQSEVGCNGNIATSNTVYVPVSTPQVTGTTPGSRCGYGPVTLGATGSATGLNWYSSPSATTPLGSGNSFTTPNISSTTTFYVAANDGGVSAPMNLLTTTAAGNSATGVLFDINVINTIRIDSFSDYVPVGTNASVYYRVGTGYGGNQSSSVGWTQVLAGGAVTNMTGVLGIVPGFANLTLTPGLYSFAILTSASNSYTNGSVVGNIYASDANVQIKEGYGGGGVYPSTIAFVNSPRVWNGRLYYSTMGCESPKTAVLASINTPPTMTVSTADPTLCPGGTTTVSVSSVNDPNYTYSWTSVPAGFTATGAGPHNVSPSTTTKYYVNAVDNTSGAFSGCSTFDSVTVITAPALLSGTVSSTIGNICISGTPTLSVSGSAGGLIQWQEASNMSGPWSNIGTGTSTYTPSSPITQTTYYRVQVSCQSTAVYSNVVTVTVNNPLILSTVPGQVCGSSGTAILSATANAGTDIKWYATPTGGTVLATGSSYTTPLLTSSTTYYAEPSIGGGGGTASPIQVTEMDLGTNDGLEIQNVSPDPINVAGWKVVVSNSYTDINSVNANVQTLSGTMLPGEIKTWTDLSTATNYWGSNILWNPGAYPTFTGWAAILDNNNVLKDIVFMNWPASNIAAAAVPIGTSTITVGSQWTGNGIDITTVAATNSVSRQGTSDNNTAADFSIIPLSMASTNSGMTLPFSGFGCVGSRVPVPVVVGPCNTTLNVTCFIQGYWDGTSAMVPTLTNQGEPSTTGACDSIDVELHSDVSPFGVDATVRTVLQQNGTATCVFPPMTGNKYIAVKHRNALQTWSANAIPMGTTVSYNFSTAANMAYGDNQIEVSTSPSVWAFYSGDIIVDENMDLLDLGSLESDISNFGYGYLNTDLNGDGNVDLLDSPMLESNISNFIYSNHP